MIFHSDLYELPVKNKRVIVRTDFNTPRNRDGTLANDFRLKESLPTLQALRAQGAKIVILSHCARPQANESQFSLEPIAQWLENNGFSVTFAPTLKVAQKNANTDIILVENLRFFKEEQEQSKSFAQELKKLGDFFIQDAFATLHRNDTSITLLPQLFSKEKKTIGLLVEKELTLLKNLKEAPKQPFLLILGGSKAATKLPIIEGLFDKLSALLVCPAIVFTLLKAQGKSVGKSLVDTESIELAKKLLQKAEQEGVDVIFPIDYLVTDSTFEKPSSITCVKEIGPEQTALSFGPKTAQLFKTCILQARTIFLNGVSGNPQYPETLEGMRSIFQALQQTPATKIIGGGDAVLVAQKLGFGHEIGTLLTGGGATLSYLSGFTLPGLLALR